MFRFTVHPDNSDSYEAKATSRDVVTWEKLGKGRSLSKIAENAAMGDLYGLAHVASVRLNLFSGSLNDFENSVDLEIIEESESDPTRPTP